MLKLVCICQEVLQSSISRYFALSLASALNISKFLKKSLIVGCLWLARVEDQTLVSIVSRFLFLKDPLKVSLLILESRKEIFYLMVRWRKTNIDFNYCLQRTETSATTMRVLDLSKIKEKVGKEVKFLFFVCCEALLCLGINYRKFVLASSSSLTVSFRVLQLLASPIVYFVIALLVFI